MADKEMTLEERFAELDRLLRAMEDPNVSLEESFDMYTAGMQLIKDCNSSIDRIEQKLTVMEEEQ